MGEFASRAESPTFDNIETPEQLLEFMDRNIKYGWLDEDKQSHIGNLKGFREHYRTSSIEETLASGLGTCIEQAYLAKYWLGKAGLVTKMYCHRSYNVAEGENEGDSEDQKIDMHCFVLYALRGKWYHFEHSNFPKRGIHEYNDPESAIKDVTEGFAERGELRKLTEFYDLPAGLSFREFNDSIDTLRVLSTDLSS